MEWFEKLAKDEKSLVEHAKVVKTVNENGGKGAIKASKSLGAIAANGHENYPLSKEHEAQAVRNGINDYNLDKTFGKDTKARIIISKVNKAKRARGETDLLNEPQDLYVNNRRIDQWADSTIANSAQTPVAYNNTKPQVVQQVPAQPTPIQPVQQTTVQPVAQQAAAVPKTVA